MKNKWSSEKVKSVQQWLTGRWPDLFTPGPNLLPLSLNIHVEILRHRTENPELSSRSLEEALNRHTKSYGYLYGLCKYIHRYTLDGTAEQKIADDHKARARWMLKQQRKKYFAGRKKRAPINQSSVQRYSRSPNSSWISSINCKRLKADSCSRDEKAIASNRSTLLTAV